MAEKGSFWSTLPGVLTGIAGLVTAVVALVSLAASQGWIGGGGGGGAGPAGDGDTPVRLEVQPESLQFRAVPGASREETVTVVNDGDAPVQLDEPRIEGADADQFDVDGGACTGDALPAGRSCEIVVTFDGGLGDASATLVLTPSDGRAYEIPLEAGVV
ncbi:MAG: hypothetical protein M3N25_05045 [Actinomycetota bacterium]|nr:hypothetical protein [Actinomycetota bacterium]MDP9020156.1 hypothetical protein [Actinomycetota bacterium]